jgi:hypothetical protein
MKESIGTVVLSKQAKDVANEPDSKLPSGNLIHTSRTSSAPRHWGGTKYMTGKFGANPKSKKTKKKKMSHIKDFKSFTKVEEQSQVSSIPNQFKSENDAINQLKNTIVKMEQDVAAKKLDLNNKTKMLQDKMSAEKAKQENLNAQ